MALGMMLPGMPAGWLQEKLGYLPFFAWVCAATLFSFLAAAFIKVDPAFGKKASA
jgi:MFS transporter, PAT family, beta-lactamase induction signal transducer AmpG